MCCLNLFKAQPVIQHYVEGIAASSSQVPASFHNVLIPIVKAHAFVSSPGSIALTIIIDLRDYRELCLFFLFRQHQKGRHH